MRIAHTLLATSACVAMSASSGCTLVVIGVIAAVAADKHADPFQHGELLADQAAPVDEAYLAAILATETLGFEFTSATIDGDTALIESRRINGDATTIRLTRSGPEGTRIAIRVGTLGSESASLLLLDSIESRLDDRRHASYQHAGLYTGLAVDPDRVPESEIAIGGNFGTAARE